MFRNLLLPGLFIISVLTTAAQNVFKISSGATLYLTGGAVITLQDMDLDNDGSISQPGNSKFLFSGIQNNKISGTGTGLFDTIETAKTNNGGIVLQRTINIGSAINCSSGNIDLNNFTILLQSNAVLNNESETSHITGTAGGYVQITANLDAPASFNPGNLGAIITSSNNLGSTIIRRGHRSQTTGSGTGASIERYFDIIPANNTALNAALRMQYFDAELNGRDKNLLTFWKSEDNSHWQDLGFTTRSPSLHYVGLNGITAFSRWTLSDINGALPLTLLYFKAACTGNMVELNWETANESGIDKFIIERSADGISWIAIKTVPSRGNSTADQLYLSMDDSGVPGNVFYRLVIKEKDGAVSYSPVTKNNCSQVTNISVIPNPVTTKMQVVIAAAQQSAGDIKIYNTQGQLLLQQKINIAAGINYLPVDMSRFAAGVYELSVESSSGRQQIKKIIKQ